VHSWHAQNSRFYDVEVKNIVKVGSSVAAADGCRQVQRCHSAVMEMVLRGAPYVSLYVKRRSVLRREHSSDSTAQSSK
jgi:hypothetical protein